MKKHLILFIVLGLLFAGPAYADLFGFYNITNNNATNAAIGEAQLSVDVTDPGGSQVLFTFLNSGPEPSSITQIYFDDDDENPVLNVPPASFDNGGFEVDFSYNANPGPGDLPGGNTVSFAADFAALADNPAPQNGVNPGESLGIYFSLLDEITFSDVINSLFSEDLRVGLHVQSFSSGSSESFVNTSGGSERFVNNGPITNPIPEPATMLLLGSGLIGFAVVGRKKFFKKS